MRWWWVMALALGCGGRGGSDTGAGDDDDFTFPTNQTACSQVPTNQTACSQVPTNQTACSQVPTFDVAGMSCDALGSAFEQVMDASLTCDADTDCAMARPQCEDWVQVSCWYPYNKDCVSASTLAAFNTQAATINCNPPIGSRGECKCGSPPEVQCVNHRCCSPVLEYDCQK